MRFRINFKCENFSLLILKQNGSFVRTRRQEREGVAAGVEIGVRGNRVTDIDESFVKKKEPERLLGPRAPSTGHVRLAVEWSNFLLCGCVTSRCKISCKKKLNICPDDATA